MRLFFSFGFCFILIKVKLLKPWLFGANGIYQNELPEVYFNSSFNLAQYLAQNRTSVNMLNEWINDNYKPP